MFTCAKIRFNQLAFLIGRLHNMYISEIRKGASWPWSYGSWI